MQFDHKPQLPNLETINHQNKRYEQDQGSNEPKKKKKTDLDHNNHSFLRWPNTDPKQQQKHRDKKQEHKVKKWEPARRTQENSKTKVPDFKDQNCKSLALFF